MKTPGRNGCSSVFISLLLMGIVACSDGGNNANSRAELTVSVQFSEIQDLVFAQRARLSTNAVDRLQSISFSVATKPGNHSADVFVQYDRSYLERRGLLDDVAGSVSFPVFALYAGYANDVDVVVKFSGGEEVLQQYMLQTPSFEHPNHDVGEIIVHRIQTGAGLNFIAAETLGPSVVIFDIDGERRWISPPLGEIVRTHFFQGDHWIIASANNNSIYRVFWDGDSEAHAISDPRYVDTHHNMDPGKVGILNNVGFEEGDVHHPESVLIEMEGDGTVLKSWYFDEIVSEFIQSRGEDPGKLIQNDLDWFHMNSAVYDKENDALLVSSRENFVIKVDYSSGDIRWLLGNPEKLWYTEYPNSLQTLALDITGRPPIGQHALQLSPDGKRLLLFNNGAGNLNLPNVGDNQSESVLSIYDIDEESRTAREAWRYEHMPPIFSPFCSGVHWLDDGSILASYSIVRSATIDGREIDGHSRLVHISPEGEVLYEASVLTRESDVAGCLTVYKARAISLDKLRLQ